MADEEPIESTDGISFTESVRRLRASGGHPWLFCGGVFWAVVVGSYWWFWDYTDGALEHFKKAQRIQ